MRSQAILYVTVDGVLQALAHSQVCRVLIGLAKRGFHYRLLSLESEQDLADTVRVSELRSQLADHGIAWTSEPYDQRGSARAAATNLGRVARQMGTLVRRGGIGLVHARGYHSALVARSLKGILGTRYVFDARGRWIDERLLGGRWFTNPAIEAGARTVERQLYCNADAIVVLTQLHADDVRGGDFGEYRGVPLRVITTCADFASFRLEPRFSPVPAESSRVPPMLAQRLAGKLVIAFVGSRNAFYRYEESFGLAASILARRADAHLLIISAQRAEFEALAQRSGIAEDRITLTTVPHHDMPEWLCRVDWAIQLLNGGVAKRGSMPTKLAEFLATGVRPIHFGCNDEVSSWVARTGSGVVLKSLTAQEFERAAEHVGQQPPNRALLEQARVLAQPHFDLASGLDRYQALLQTLGINRL
jgi:hypothetical protein